MRDKQLMFTGAKIAIEQNSFKKMVSRDNIRQVNICLIFIVVPKQRKVKCY